MLFYSFTVLMDGLYLCGIDNKYFNYYEQVEPWYKRLIGIMIQFVKGTSLSLFFWNLAFVYWSSAEVLRFE